MDKPHRRNLIVKLLKGAPVLNQEHLRDLLRGAGVDATQGTLSRDLRELGVVKGPAGYLLPGANNAPTKAGSKDLELALGEHLISAGVAGTLVILKTEPGHAQALAFQLDRSPLPKVAGTLAGDDTIFIATRSSKDAAAVLKSLDSMGGLS